MIEEPDSKPRVTITTDDHGVADVRLNRADKLNALDDSMFAALLAAGGKLSVMPGLRCVVLSGEGRGFCTGLDLSMFAQLTSPDAPSLAKRTHGNANLFQQVAMQWRMLPVPVIAAVHGICFGGGLQITAGADIRIVTPDARLAVMEMKWGIIPDMGGFSLWRSLVREDVLRALTYTAREFSGAEAVAMGFATFLDAEPLTKAMAMAHEIAEKHPQAIGAAKQLYNQVPDLVLDDILLAESREQDLLIGSPNQIEAVQSAMAGRTAKFTNS
jgi:enoyl-CoA hydratase/carnithine racemase